MVVQDWLVTHLAGLHLVAVFFLFIIFLAFSRFARIRLGRMMPRLTIPGWIAMLSAQASVLPVILRRRRA